MRPPENSPTVRGPLAAQARSQPGTLVSVPLTFTGGHDKAAGIERAAAPGARVGPTAPQIRATAPRSKRASEQMLGTAAKRASRRAARHPCRRSSKAVASGWTAA